MNSYQITFQTKDMQSLLEIRDPLHFVVVRSDNHGTNTLVGTRSVEWRLVNHYIWVYWLEIY